MYLLYHWHGKSHCKCSTLISMKSGTHGPTCGASLLRHCLCGSCGHTRTTMLGSTDCRRSTFFSRTRRVPSACRPLAPAPLTTGMRPLCLPKGWGATPWPSPADDEWQAAVCRPWRDPSSGFSSKCSASSGSSSHAWLPMATLWRRLSRFLDEWEMWNKLY